MRSWLCIACVACGSVSDDKPDAKVTDAPVDQPVDGVGPPCDVTKPFGAPTVVGGVSGTGQDRWPSLSADELTIYLSDMLTDRSLLFATRGSLTGTFSTPAPIPGVNTTSTEEHPYVTEDGLTLIAESNGFGNGVEVVMATRTSKAVNFGTLNPVANVNSAMSDADPYISPDGLTLMFTSTRNGAGAQIFRATRSAVTDPFSNVGQVTEFGAGGGPTMSKDGLEVFFIRAAEIMRATRNSPTGTFGTPLPVNEVNDSNFNDFVGWISYDRCRLYFSSDRLGTFDVYVATRPK